MSGECKREDEKNAAKATILCCDFPGSAILFFPLWLNPEQAARARAEIPPSALVMIASAIASAISMLLERESQGRRIAAKAGAIINVALPVALIYGVLKG